MRRSLATSDRGGCARRARAAVRRAFSLAEVMIALVILGIGLLFIAAALPVGVEYSRQSLDLSTADGAGRFAASVASLGMKADSRLYDAQMLAANIEARQESVFRPLLLSTANPPVVTRMDAYEPFIKVRPLPMSNIDPRQMNRPVGTSPEAGVVYDVGESAIFAYIGTMAPTLGLPLGPISGNLAFLERDPQPTAAAPLNQISLSANPIVAATDRFFPPIQPVSTFDTAEFFAGGAAGLGQNQYRRYTGRVLPYGGGQVGVSAREAQKAADSRIAWTAFYRRADSDRFEGTLRVPGDPLLFELIVVVTRRPSTSHRFPQQDFPTGNNIAEFESPTARVPPAAAIAPADPIGWDRLAPSPWLVTFRRVANGVPLLTPNPTFSPTGPGDYYPYLPPPAAANTPSDRPLRPGFVRQPTLTFECTEEVGHLLPVGSVFIPAANDSRPDQNDSDPTIAGPQNPRLRAVGFVPHDPDSLPIYTVVSNTELPAGGGYHRIEVQNNGVYPWINPTFAGLDEAAWPVWVIPPSFTERDAAGQPVFERTSPVIAVVRRMVRLPEARP